MHDWLCQHLKLKQFTNELYVAQWAASSFISGLLQLHPEALTLLTLQADTSLCLVYESYDKFTLNLNGGFDSSYVFGSLQFLLLFLKDLIIILVLLKLFLAAVEQQFAEVHKNSWLVWSGDFQLVEDNIQCHQGVLTHIFLFNCI